MSFIVVSPEPYPLSLIHQGLTPRLSNECRPHAQVSREGSWGSLALPPDSVPPPGSPSSQHPPPGHVPLMAPRSETSGQESREATFKARAGLCHSRLIK